ncbi:MAG TPA: hypothetical protein VGM67_02450 [Gemmatimonadaceae bacterium]
MRKTILFVAVGVFAWMGAACDQCVATTHCGATSPAIVINGQIVRTNDGRGVDGIQIDVIRTAGVATATDSFSVTTSGGGFWKINSPTSAAGTATFTFRVHTPNLPHPYVVAGRDISTVDRGGDAVVLERWVDQPYLPYYIDIFLRPTGGSVGTVHTEFRRRGSNWEIGSSPSDSVVGGATDVSGRLQLYMVPGDTGAVDGDLIADLPSPFGPSVVGRLELQPTYMYRAKGGVLRGGAGPSLDYAIQVYDRATARPLAGATFEATRISGIETTVSSGTGVTDKDGYARFPFRPLGSGNLVFDVTYHSPKGTTETHRDTMPTFDSDAGRLLTNQSIGPYFNYYGLLESGFNSPLVGVPVRIRRTGGIDISPADTTILTTSDGAIPINAIPAAAGTVVLELTFNLPGKLPRFMVSNLVIETMEQDFPSGKTVWVWDVNAGLSAPPGSQVTPLP